MHRTRTGRGGTARWWRRLPFVAEERGTAVIEFAMVAPLLFLIVFAVIDFGRAFYTINQLVTSVREGGRYASLRVTPGNLAQYEDSVRLVVRQAAPSLEGGINPSLIKVEVDAAAATVTVRVQSYPFKLITPLARTVLRQHLTFTRAATFRLEQA